MSTPLQEAHDACVSAEFASSLPLAQPLRPEALEPRQTEPASPREKHHPEGDLTDVALSKMTGESDTSVRDLRGRITWMPEWGALLRFNSYRSTPPKDPSRAHVMLQLELLTPRTSASWSVTRASLKRSRDAYMEVDVWQALESPDANVRVLMETHVDARKFGSPYQLRLEMKGSAQDMILVFDGITFP